VAYTRFDNNSGLYWATSNLVAIGQQLTLRFVISRENQAETKM
jgi:membrane protein insertase Oxa1/YidC/SpoIIIJ